MTTRIFILILLTCWGHAVISNCAHADTAAGLSCPRGLIVHRYAPESAEAKLLRTRKGVELRASQPLLTITGSMVEEALISKYYQYNSPEERARLTPSETFFSVSLQLNRTGSNQVEKVLAGKRNAEFVVVCNGVVLIASPVGHYRVEAVDVLIDDSAEAAEQFARSFTPKVRFERRTPNPE